jgi:hypothetical protein
LTADLGGVWESLETCGYALTDDESVGLPQKFRENFDQTYFSDQILRPDEGDWPIDRKRARDVIRHWWNDGELDLAEHDTITITNRAGIPGKREHARVNLLSDPQAEELVRAYDPADVLDDGEATAEPILRRQLNPGQIIIFEDSRFKHGATPLVPPPGESAMRDALICTVDYVDTYLVN